MHGLVQRKSYPLHLTKYGSGLATLPESCDLIRSQESKKAMVWSTFWAILKPLGEFFHKTSGHTGSQPRAPVMPLSLLSYLVVALPRHFGKLSNKLCPNGRLFRRTNVRTNFIQTLSEWSNFLPTRKLSFTK
jgi:hypothetical protein